jgi:uncharacterized protein (DUF305 family)
MSKGLITALFIITFILGIGTGYYLTPNYLLQSTEMGTNNGTAEQTDFQYLKDMTAHHKGAIKLAEQVLNQTQNEEIKQLANMIITEELKSIATLENELSTRFKSKDSISATKVVNLGTYDKNLDLRFLNSLIKHHQEGVLMAKDIQYKSTNNFVLSDAQGVESFLTQNLTTLESLREKLY